MTEANNNDAARLLSVIQRARGVNQQTKGVEGWATVFGLKSDDLRGVLIESARIIEMVERLPGKLEEVVPGDAGLYLEHYREVERVAARFNELHAHMAHFLEPINRETGEYCLQLCARQLARDPNPGLPKESVEDFVRQVDELIEMIHNSDDLSTKNKHWLVSQLGDIRYKLDPQRLYPASDIAAAGDVLLGGIYRNWPMAAELVGKGKPVLKKLGALVVALHIAASLGADSKELFGGDAPPSESSANTVVEQVNIVMEDQRRKQEGSRRELMPPISEIDPPAEGCDELKQ